MAKQTIKTIKCMDCINAALLQWDNNPVIAHCRYSEYHNVANTLHPCIHFKQRLGNPEIRKLTHYR